VAAESVATALTAAHAEQWGRIVASLIRITGDWALAEDAAQDAFEKATARWPRDGVPDNPGAWLSTVARNAAIDRLRRRATEVRKAEEANEMDQLTRWRPDDSDIGDDRLRLIFTCAHPALPMEARVALTLRTVAGLTTPEIARAFLVPEATVAQRIVRAQRKIANAGIPYRVPPGHLLPERRGGVLAVLYLVFTEGYAASSGEQALRPELIDEAIRLARLLAGLMPDDSEVLGLLALMLLQDSRRDARVDLEGVPLSLEEQDRSLWNREQITEGLAVLDRARRLSGVGSYQLQARIAACHATAPDAEHTDFGRIVRLYGLLLEVHPSPMIELARAIAVGMAFDPAEGLELIADLGDDPRLRTSFLMPAAQADLLRRLGRTEEAAERYSAAETLAPTTADRAFLTRRRQSLPR
jgi:RNA polymerase sigma-70 factor (ECF subfamily)